MAGLRNILVMISVVLLLGSCSMDEFGSLPVSGSDYTALSFTGDPMSKYKVGTRASDSKTEDEKRINNLYIFFFDQDGNYLEGSYLEGYTGASKSGGYYAPGQGVTTLKIANNTPDQYFKNPEAAKSAIVYALANVDPKVMGLGDLDDYGRPKSISNMTELEEKFYCQDATLGNDSPNENKLILLSIPERGMPMAGKKTVDLTKAGSGSDNAEERTIELKALMARVDLNIRLDCEVDVPGLPKLTLMEWTAVNMPTGVKIGEPVQDSDNTVLEDSQKINDITRTQYRQISNHNGEISLSFYMYENVQFPDPDYKYPGDIKDDEKQRYKPEMANEDAAAVTLHCNYATYNDKDGNATYDVYYTIYLGADHTDDFTVRRNHQYKNDITIAGLIQHDAGTGADTGADTGGDNYSFDARVNVDNDANNYHIAILRERNHDAHFCVTPMDVYLFADESLNPQLTVTIDEDAKRWLGMELIPASNMADGSAPDTDAQIATGTAWTAGNGKRKYFTIGLVDELNGKNKGTVTVTNNRDRVYFYLNENIDKNPDRTLKEENRQATVTLTYTDNNTSSESRTFIIEQLHLLPVRTYEENDRDDNGNYTSASKITIYMEQIEEYLNHYDPLDISYTPQIYPGLPWAQAGIPLANTMIEKLAKREGVGAIVSYYENPYLVIHDGFEYTAYIIYLAEQGSMTLNDTPHSAFQYCWNKNVRNNNNQIDDGIKHHDKNNWIIGDKDYYYTGDIKGKWFLPGIRQMEQSLVAYFTTFPEFQDNYYWSSSAAEAWGQTSGQNPSYARATKVDYNGSYAQSGGQYNNQSGQGPWLYPDLGGYAPRTEDQIRIRAFRIDIDDYNY